MRYNPEHQERAITIEELAEQGRNAIKDLPPRKETHRFVWNNGNWVFNPFYALSVGWWGFVPSC